MIVIDTNIVIALIIENKILRDKVFNNQSVIAPSYIKLEVLNVLRKYHVSHKIPLHIIDVIYQDFIEIVDQFIPDEVLLESARDISFSQNHPIYDCLFLSLAHQFDAAFLSFDKRFLNKASQMGIKVIEI